MTLHRRRICGDCGKPLGGTVGQCYECGGEKPAPSRDERLADAMAWKTLLAIPYETIAEAHNQ